MAKTSRGRCVYTRFDKEILCAGTMTDWLVILSRAQAGVTDPDALSSTEEFTEVFSAAGRLETVRGTPRFDGVNIQGDRTHVGYVPYDQTVFELDRGTFWIKKEGARDRYFKVEAISEYGDSDMWIEIDLKETGFTDKTAAET